jgi:hypothetical protein
VTKVEPVDVKEWVKSYDKKSGKDVSTQFTNNHYRVLLYTHEGLGENFFNGVKPADLHKNDAARKKLEEYSEVLTRFNTWVDAVVERRNGFYFIKDTKIVF